MAKLVSIETTPNPNSMKLNFEAPLGFSGTFKRQELAKAPEKLQSVLQIDGVESLFAVAQFLTINRDPRADWQPILDAAQQLFSHSENDTAQAPEISNATGQVQVWVQTFRGIPIQVKVTEGPSEQRLALADRFGEAARQLQAHYGADYLKERHWADWGIRYGTPAETTQAVAEEIESLMDETALERQKNLALGQLMEETALVAVANKDDFETTDWQKRFHFIQQLEATEETAPLLIQALDDEKPQIRRWAAARLGSVKNEAVVKALCKTFLNDANPGVRRTAGDSLSDIGDPAAEQTACKALLDSNKLVRWRAARFLAELGSKTALPLLQQAADDPEYEVRMEVEAAIAHIQSGSAAAMPVWKLMSQDTPQDAL